LQEIIKLHWLSNLDIQCSIFLYGWRKNQDLSCSLARAFCTLILPSALPSEMWEGRNCSCVSQYWQISVKNAYTVNQWTCLQSLDLSPWMGNHLSYYFPTGISKNIIRVTTRNRGIKTKFWITREIPNIFRNIAGGFIQ
jgi:hypothetical protein